MVVWARVRDGLQFGMLLQLAVGPACLYVLRAAADQGWMAGMAAASAVFFVDCIFLLLATLGMARWVGGDRDRRWMRLIAALVVALFAIDIGASALGRAILPSFASVSLGSETGPFVGAFLLTAANPLTIVFWAGVFGAKLAAERWGRRDLLFFSAGCVGATLLFLGAVAFLGSIVGAVAPGWLLRVLNLGVAVALLALAIRIGVSRAASDAVAQTQAAEAAD